MKKILLLSAVMFSAVAAMAQSSATLMHVKTSDGTVHEHIVSDIYEITFPQIEFIDDYKLYKLTIDPEKASCPDDADGCHNSIYNVDGTDGQHMEGLFGEDGYFTSCYFEGHKYDETYHSYVEIDLGKQITGIAFEVKPRPGFQGNMPKEVEIYALNGETWTKIGSEEDLENKIDATGYAPVGPVSAWFPFSKVRFCVVRGHGNIEMSGVMAVTTGYWDCAHLVVYGN